MKRLSTAPVAAGSILGGFLLARRARTRSSGLLVLVPAAAWCARRWKRSAGPGATVGLLGLYVAAVGGPHPLARKLGTWPAVAAASAVAGLGAWVVSDRRGGAAGS